MSFTEDYGAGFKKGFAEYLYEGDTTEPPPVPPPQYQTIKYQTPEGVRAIEDWFSGFRHGATVAQQGNFRELVTGPPSSPAPKSMAAPAATHSHESVPGPAVEA